MAYTKCNGSICEPFCRCTFAVNSAHLLTLSEMEAQPRNKPSTLCDGNEKHLRKPAAALAFQGLTFSPLTLPKGNFSNECTLFPTAHLTGNQPAFLQPPPERLPCLYLKERVWYCVSPIFLQSKTTVTAKLSVYWSNWFSTCMLLLTIFTLLIVSLPYEASGGLGGGSVSSLSKPHRPTPPPKTFVLTTLTNFNYSQQISNSLVLIRWFLPFPS